MRRSDGTLGVRQALRGSKELNREFDRKRISQCASRPCPNETGNGESKCKTMPHPNTPIRRSAPRSWLIAMHQSCHIE